MVHQPFPLEPAAKSRIAQQVDRALIENAEKENLK